MRTTKSMVGNDFPTRSVAKIALFFPSLAGGGMEKTMLTTAAALARRNHRVEVVVCRAQGPLRNQIPATVRVVELERAPMWKGRWYALRADPQGIGAMLMPVLLPRKPPGRLPYLPALVDYLRRERPDALFAASSGPNLQAIWARRLAKVRTRIVVSQHTTMSRAQMGSPRWKHRFLPPLARRGYLMADAIVAVSEGVAQDLVAHAGVSRERISKIYNPVVTAELLVRAKEPLDHPWLKPGAPPVILGAGRLVTPKDFSTLLRAFARVRAQRKARLVILGEGKQHKELESLARQLGVCADVALPGFVANPCAYMARAAVFVLSSAWEGFGNVIVEALACGCPVVSTDCPSGPSEILGDGAYGPLVPVGNDVAMAEAILAILESSTDSGRLRSRAAEFSDERAVDDYLDVLLGTRRKHFTVAQMGAH